MRSHEALDIDESELSDLPLLGVFMRGYELGEIEQRLRGRRGFEESVTAGNAERIAKACERQGRRFVLKWMQDDRGEEWMRLVVYPRND